MAERKSFLVFAVVLVQILSVAVSVNVDIRADLHDDVWGSGPHLVKREERKAIVLTENGEISSVWAPSGSYQLQFITLDPNSLYLPVLLHADMVFYVHKGSGRLSWTDEDELKHADLVRGDVYTLRAGTVFFMQSGFDAERAKLRINTIFRLSDHHFHGQAPGAYSSIRDMVVGFDSKVLQAAFQVSEQVIEEMLHGPKPPAIVHGVTRTKTTAWEMEAQFIRGLMRIKGYGIFEPNKKREKKTTKLFNIFSEDKDFQNCHGWSTMVNQKKLNALKGSDINVFMVNLASGSMMGPHWNPRATEIAIVLQGQGMVHVACSSIPNCKNLRLKVEEGDVFAVPRFYPMAQMAFNNDTFVFMGFSTAAKKNYPQFLAGGASVLRALDKKVLESSFNIDNATLDRLLSPQGNSVILGCTSCAEEELRVVEEEIEKERKREEEEERRRKEEESRKREEEAARRQEEERRRKEEQKEAEKRREAEEARKRAEEEARRRQEEEATRRRQEEEEARKREGEQAAKEEEEARRREKEQEEAQRREEEEARRREEEEARKRAEEEKRSREQQEAEEVKRREEEQAAREEEEARRREKEQEEAQRREEEERRRAEEEVRRRQQQQEEEAKRRQQEQASQAEAQRRAEEEARHREEEQRGRSEEEQAAEQERRRQEEARREEEAERQRQGGGGGGQQVFVYV